MSSSWLCSIITTNYQTINIKKYTKSSLTISLRMILRGFPYIHAEHDRLWSHGGHPVAEAVLEDAVHVSSKGVLATGLSVSCVDHKVIRTNNLKDETHRQKVTSIQTYIIYSKMKGNGDCSTGLHYEYKCVSIKWEWTIQYNSSWSTIIHKQTTQ